MDVPLLSETKENADHAGHSVLPELFLTDSALKETRLSYQNKNSLTVIDHSTWDAMEDTSSWYGAILNQRDSLPINATLTSQVSAETILKDANQSVMMDLLSQKEESAKENQFIQQPQIKSDRKYMKMVQQNLLSQSTKTS